MQVEQPTVPLPTASWRGYEPADADPGVAPYKRAGGTKADLLKRYQQRLKTSARWRDDEGYEKTWKRLIDLYRNKQFATNSTEDRIAVNIAFSTVNTIVPSVAVNNPVVTVNARRDDEQPAASAAEAAVNYWWDHYRWRKDVKRAVKDSLITGNGWVKVGWRYETKKRALGADEHAAAIDQAQQQAGDAAEQNPEQAAELPTDLEIEGQAPAATQEVVHDCPFVERVSPFDMLIDPEATCEEDLKWIAQRLVLPLEDVKKDDRYGVGARRSLQADASTNVRWRDDKDDSKGEKYADDVKRVTVWEFYDLRSHFYCVFADNSDTFLLEPTDFPYPYGSPYVFLGNYDVPDQFYCMGDLEALEPLQLELNATRSDMVNHRKRYQRAYLVKRDALDTAAQNSLLANRDNRIIYVDGDQDLANVVVPVPQTQLDAQMYQHSSQIEADVDLVSGVSEYQRGAVSEIRRTATEASMIQDASNARSSDKLAQIEGFMGEIAKHVVQLAQQYLTGEHMARIVGVDGAAKWVPFANDQIQGEFDFQVEAGSTQPKDETFRRQQALQLMNVMGQFIGTVVNPKSLAAYVLRDGFGLKNVDQFLMDPPPTSGGPSDKMIETINYKDAPPDVQRQMEAAAGMTPSMIGPNAPPVNPNAPNDPSGGASSAPPSGEQAPPGTAPTDMPQEGAALPMAGQNIPPELLAQLSGQMGLDVPNVNAA